MATRKPRGERAALAAELEAKEADRRSANRARLWDIISRAYELGVEAGITTVGAGFPSATTGISIEVTEYVKCDNVNVPCSSYTEHLTVRSFDSTFEEVEQFLDAKTQEVEAERAAKLERDAVLSTLTEDQRRILGFSKWSKK